MSTEKMRAALDWCEARGLSPTAVHHDGRIDFHTKGREQFESRDAFVALCRAAGVLDVTPLPGFVYAHSVVDGFNVTVYSGEWTRGRLLDRLADELEADLQAVHVGGAA